MISIVSKKNNNINDKLQTKEINRIVSICFNIYFGPKVYVGLKNNS